MARTPRREVIDESQGGVYHCINRCARRAYLCGEDAVSGCSFEHRKEWVRGRMEELAGIFGIDVLGYTVMSNHLHVVLRNRPDVVANRIPPAVLPAANLLADMRLRTVYNGRRRRLSTQRQLARATRLAIRSAMFSWYSPRHGFRDSK